jgi:GEVED domain/Secretion system C-terminal sorting domain
MNQTIRYRFVEGTTATAKFLIPMRYYLCLILFMGLSMLQSVSAQTYCMPLTNCSSGAHISLVTIGTVNNSSSCSNNGYADYTKTITPDSIQAGTIKTIKVLTGTPSGYSSGNLAFWIDFNKNGIFDSSEYFFMGSGLGTTFTKQILVSSSTPGGLTTMRIRRVLNGSLNPGAACGSYLYGETEDYPIYIKPAEVVISHVPFRDTLYSPSIELNANIKQIDVGLNTTDSLGPRIWVRRYGTTAWKILKGQMMSGNSTNGNWKFLIPFDSLGVRRNGCDSIQYYFVAQDLHVPPNIGYLPEPASHTSVLVQQSPPSELFGFRIKPRLKDTIYVSQSDCRYQSLSSVNGLFSEINARGLEGDLTVLIESDLSETGEVPLLGQRQNGYRIQVRPSAAVLRSLNASSANTGMIRLDSVQKFVIDGSFNGQGRYLRFSNSSANYDTISHIKLYHGCDSVLIQHSIFENALCTSVWLAWGQNKNIVLYNNLFRNTPTSISRRHILSLGGNNTALVRKNEFSNFLESGIRVLSGNNWIIDSNHFYRSVTPNTYSYDCSGVSVMGEGHLIENNFIGGQAPFVGGGAWKFIDNPQGDIALIDILGAPGTNAVVVRRNRIDNFIMSKTTAAYASSFSGIRCMNNKAVIEENIIGDPNDSSGYSIKAQASVLSGIYVYTAQPIIIRDNSVSSININEANTSVASMYGIYGSAGNNPFTVDISRNKIFHLYNPWNTWTTNTAGINTGGGVSNVVEANTIHDVQVYSGQINGIIFAYNRGSNTAKVQRNRIYDIVHGDPSLPWGSQIGEINGILIQNVGSPLDIVNNQVSLNNRGYISPVTVRGIDCEGPNSNTTKRILYNSVFIGGTASQNAGSAVVVAALNRPARIANNIFYNKRTGGTTGHFEYWTTGGTPYYTGFSSTQTNNNLYVLRDTTKFVNWYLVGSSPFSNWKTFVHPEDSSYLKTTIEVPDTGFFVNAAKGDLHIDTSGVFAWVANDKGRGIAGIDGDFDTTGVRSVDPFHPTDIGSDEFKAWHLPANATCIGGTRSFTTTTPGSSFQWQVNSGSGYINLANDNDYSGVTTGTLQITNVSFRWDGYHYRAIVNGSPADSFSLAVVDSIPISVVISGPASACPGASLSFLAVPTNGGTSPTYQWQVNGVNVGSNSNTFTTSTLINNDQVHVIMRGSACSSPSTIASNTITVNTASSRANAGNDTTICDKQSVTIGAAPGANTYEWTSMPAGFTSSLSNPTVHPSVTTTYFLKVTSSASCITYDTVVVRVNPSPVANAGPDQTICSGGPGIVIGTLAIAGNTYLWTPQTGLNAANIAMPTANPLNTTIYTLTVTSAQGCSASDATNITVTPLPSAPVITQAGNTLNSSAATGNQWYLNGTTIAGATGASYIPLVSGLYTVKVTVNGCTSAASDPFNFVPTAINAPVLDKNITMVPNPVRDRLFIRYNGNTTTLYINLIDISGRKINSRGTFTSTYFLEMRGLSAGLYVVQIVNSRNGDEVRRLIVKE